MLTIAALLLAIAPATRQSNDFPASAEQLFRSGKYDQILDLANRMLESAAPDDPRRARYLLERAGACTELLDRDCAMDALDRAQPIAEAAHDRRAVALVHRERGFAFWRLDHDLNRARDEYEKALAIARAIPDWDVVVTTLNAYGNMYRNRDNLHPDVAIAKYEEALAISRREHMTATHLLKNIGDAYLLMNQPERAEAPLLEAMAVADEKNIAEVRWMTRLDLAKVYRDRDPAQAERYFTQCLALLDEEESGVLVENLRPGAFAAATAFANPYDDYVDFLMAQHRAADAFVVGERQRARVFLDALAASRDGLTPLVPKGYAAAERDGITALRRAQAALRSATLNDANRALRMREVEDAENRLSTLRLRLGLDQPALSHARYPKLWTVKELQTALLAPDEALLTFYVAPKRSFAWLITRDRLQAFELAPAKIINVRARAAMDSFRSPLGQNRAAVGQLSQALAIEKIANAIHQQHLIVVPHGILNDIPFEALTSSDGHPLIERAAISYAPSASSLAFLRQIRRPVQHPVELIAVANPVVSGTAAQRLRQFDLAHMNLLAPLPHTADEVRQVAAPFGRAADVLEGALATRAELEKRKFGQSRILHFATHGFIDENKPDRSGLLLTATPPRDDGLLQVRDIYSMRLNADLVTLSACETALGQNVTGEGIIGLTRAFFFAGAHSVVASLWDVDDESTSELMKRFYANMRRGDAVDVALQKAKLDLIHGGGTSAPFYWASFIATGDAQSPIEPRSQSSWPAIALALVTVAVIVAVRRMRRVPTSSAADRDRRAP